MNYILSKEIAKFLGKQGVKKSIIFLVGIVRYLCEEGGIDKEVVRRLL